MSTPDCFAPFNFDCFYHVFNRSNNRELLFLSDDNYQHFIKLFDKYLSSYLNVYPYCLLPNHFHFMVQVKAKEEMPSPHLDETSVDEIITEQFRKLFIAYTMAFNKQHNRNGNLFHRRFKRIWVNS